MILCYLENSKTFLFYLKYCKINIVNRENNFQNPNKQYLNKRCFNSKIENNENNCKSTKSFVSYHNADN